MLLGNVVVVVVEYIEVRYFWTRVGVARRVVDSRSLASSSSSSSSSVASRLICGVAESVAVEGLVLKNEGLGSWTSIVGREE